jgi:hypothetical protein
MDRQDVQQTSESDRMLCPNCLADATDLDFCNQCGCPVGETTNLDPIKSIQSRGFLYRAGAQSAANPVVLVGIWLVLLPFVFSPLGFALIYGPSVVALFVLSLFIAGVAVLILARATRMYFRGSASLPASGA